MQKLIGVFGSLTLFRAQTLASLKLQDLDAQIVERSQRCTQYEKQIEELQERIKDQQEQLELAREWQVQLLAKEDEIAGLKDNVTSLTRKIKTLRTSQVVLSESRLDEARESAESHLREIYDEVLEIKSQYKEESQQREARFKKILSERYDAHAQSLCKSGNAGSSLQPLVKT
eukprot:GHVT01077975.1.p1 GENE.GHVT01077975.1~~GHVT01077975.1.p1  ORF type:complete len:173 (+),score=19.72 GHVT01077975.1:422-940(+)